MMLSSMLASVGLMRSGLTPVINVQPAAVTRIGPVPEMFGGGGGAKAKKAPAKAKPTKPAKKAVAAKKPVKKVAVAKATAKKPLKKVVAKKPVKKVAKKAAPKKVVPKRVTPFKPKFETQSDLVTLAEQQNTAIGFYDPLGLAKQDFWEQGNEATIGFLRHAEIKHGRVAMAAFVGYCVQANGLYWPWAIQGGPLADGRFNDIFGTSESVYFSDIGAAGSPPAQWDALPTPAKVQILLTILILEWVGETPQAGMPHYMRGGKPGYYPPLKTAVGIPHPVPYDLYDPFGLFGDMDEATKARRRNMEINNGRLAMFGIFSLISASKGLEVPGLSGVVAPYDGEVMSFFSPSDSGLPFLEELLESAKGLEEVFAKNLAGGL